MEKQSYPECEKGFCKRHHHFRPLFASLSPTLAASSSAAQQWVEESFTNFEQGINWRSYVVCDVAYNSVNNWLWTPFIERRDANRIYIEIKFSMRDCNLFPGTPLASLPPCLSLSLTLPVNQRLLIAAE